MGSVVKYGLHSTPIFISLRTVPPNDTCLYGCINWYLAQAQQQFSLGMCQFSTSVRGGKTIPRCGVQFNVQKCPVVESSGGTVERNPHSDHRTQELSE